MIKANCRLITTGYGHKWKHAAAPTMHCDHPGCEAETSIGFVGYNGPRPETLACYGVSWAARLESLNERGHTIAVDLCPEHIPFELAAYRNQLDAIPDDVPDHPWPDWHPMRWDPAVGFVRDTPDTETTP